MELRVLEKGNIENIIKIENQFRIKLPDDYKEFLINNNGAIIKDGTFWVEDLKQKILMEKLFGINLSTKVLTIEYWSERHKNDLWKNTIIIGSDPGGTFLLLVLGNRDDDINEGIYYYDNKYFFEQSSDKQNTYYICKTFSEFIAQLKGEETK